MLLFAIARKQCSLCCYLPLPESSVVCVAIYYCQKAVLFVLLFAIARKQCSLCCYLPLPESSVVCVAICYC